MKMLYAIACLLFIVGGTANAASRDRTDVTKTYLNEGNDRTPIAVSLSSSSWTEILPADVTRRAAVIHTLSTADETVCLSTVTTSGITCTAGTKGIHLEKGGVNIDNSEQVLYGRVASGSITATAYAVYAYGMIYLDTKDVGDRTSY